MRINIKFTANDIFDAAKDKLCNELWQQIHLTLYILHPFVGGCNKGS